MIPNRITDSDMIILQSVESYLTSIGTPVSQNPQQKLMVYQHARDYLYSDIVQRVPRAAAYILTADMESDTIAQGLNMALSKHVMDPIFVDLLMQFLSTRNNTEENGIVGALLAKILNKWLVQNSNNADEKKETDKTTKKGEKAPEPVKDEKNNLEQVAHIKRAIDQLLGNITEIISVRACNLTRNQALAIAACIAMDNNETIKDIVNSDYPVTAQIFDVVKDPSNIIRSALLLGKEELPKLSPNQTAFVESLKQWVYKKLNEIPTQTSFQFLVAAYGTTKPDVSTKLINPKECGSAYPNLLTVARQMINQK